MEPSTTTIEERVPSGRSMIEEDAEPPAHASRAASWADAFAGWAAASVKAPTVIRTTAQAERRNRRMLHDRSSNVRFEGQSGDFCHSQWQTSETRRHILP